MIQLKTQDFTNASQSNDSHCAARQPITTHPERLPRAPATTGRERNTPAQAATQAIGLNVKEKVNVNSSTHFLTSSIPSGNLRAVASSRATVNSAVASVRTSGVYPTRMPLIKKKQNSKGI